MCVVPIRLRRDELQSMAPCRHRVAGVADVLGTPDVPAYQEACLAARLTRLRVLGWPLALRLVYHGRRE